MAEGYKFRKTYIKNRPAVMVAHISSLEFGKWFRNTRLVILAVMVVFIRVQIVVPLAECARLMGEPVSVFEGFLALCNSGVILMVVPILFLVLLADYPQQDGTHLSCQIRCRKRVWITGQVLFAMKACLFLVVFLFLATCILMAGCGSLQFSFSDAVTHFTSAYPDRTGDYVVQLVPGNLYQQMTLGMALLHSACMMYLHFLLLAMVILLSFLARKKYAGILADGFLIILGAVTCEVKLPAMWVFPMAHTVPWLHYEEYLSAMVFPMWGSYLYLAGGCAVLVAACLGMARRYQILS